MSEDVILKVLTEKYRQHLAAEPPQDAGGHPSRALHERVGDAWAEWDRKRASFRQLIADRLLRAHLDDEGVSKP